MAEIFKTYLYRKEGNVWDIAIYVPKEEALKFKAYKDRRVLCTVNDKNTFHCALMPQGKGDFFINTNKKFRKKAKPLLGDRVDIQQEKDTSKNRLSLPKELEIVWEVDGEGHAIFRTLTMGKQRSLVYQIGKPKSPNTRVENELTLLAYLKSVNGDLDFRKLNEAFKLADKK